jgi:hypothetical protein
MSEWLCHLESLGIPALQPFFGSFVPDISIPEISMLALV